MNVIIAPCLYMTRSCISGTLIINSESQIDSNKIMVTNEEYAPSRGRSIKFNASQQIIEKFSSEKKGNGMDEIIRKLHGANMDIDLATPPGKIAWEQDPCPWNETDKSIMHHCARKNVSICRFFCGIKYLDTVLCCYPQANPLDHDG